jgi:phosphate transport system substrate-binding protein
MSNIYILFTANHHFEGEKMDDKLKIVIAIMATAIICTTGTYVAVANQSTGNNEKTLNVGGSTTVQPLMVVFQESFEKDTGIKMNVTSGGSSVGASGAINGTLDVGMLSRDLKSSETSQGLVQYVIGKDAVAIIVNTSVTGVTGLTMEQVAKIYNGTITNWNEVGGNSQKIAVMAREEGSGTRECFDEKMTGAVSGWKMTSNSSLYSSTGGVTTAVSSTAGAIGYVSLSAAESATGIAIVKVNGVAPSSATVVDGTYTLQRDLVLATKGEASGSAYALISWILGTEGQKIVKEKGFVPVA